MLSRLSSFHSSTFAPRGYLGFGFTCSRRGDLLFGPFFRISHQQYRVPQQDVAPAVAFVLRNLFRAISTFCGRMAWRDYNPSYYPETQEDAEGSRERHECSFEEPTRSRTYQAGPRCAKKMHYGRTGSQRYPSRICVHLISHTHRA